MVTCSSDDSFLRMPLKISSVLCVCSDTFVAVSDFPVSVCSSFIGSGVSDSSFSSDPSAFSTVTVNRFPQHVVMSFLRWIKLKSNVKRGTSVPRLALTWLTHAGSVSDDDDDILVVFITIFFSDFESQKKIYSLRGSNPRLSG